MQNIITSALKWGLIGGLAIVILQTILMLISAGLLGGMWGIIVYLPLLFVMIWGGITIRRENGGDIGFAKSFMAVFIIAVLGSLIFNVYVYELWFKIIDPTFLDRSMQIAETKIRDAADKRGLSDEQVQIQINYVRNINWEKWAYVISGVCSVVLSLVVSVFVSRPDNKPPTINTES